MQESLKELLISGINQIDPTLCNDVVLKRLITLYDQITLFNPTYKLVASEKESLIIKHLLDSLAPQGIIKKYLKDGSLIADLGSGSGLPGFVLASCLENYHFSLVDRMGRRIGFLRNTIALSGMSEKIEVIESDLEKLDKVFDAVVFRAFRPLNDIISNLDRITHKDSYIFAYKSSDDNIALEKSVASSYGCFEIENIPYSVPFLDAKRSLLVLKKLR